MDVATGLFDTHFECYHPFLFFLFWAVCVKWTENIEKDSQISLAKTEATPIKEVCSAVLVTVLLVTVQ